MPTWNIGGWDISVGGNKLHKMCSSNIEEIWTIHRRLCDTKEEEKSGIALREAQKKGTKILASLSSHGSFLGESVLEWILKGM